MNPVSASTDSITSDRLLGGRVILRQPAMGYRAAVDPVLLAAAVRARAGQRVLDAGCGTGAALFCLAARVPGLSVTGLEVQPLHAALARESASLNGLENVRIVVGDIARPPADFTGAFDIVFTNPPFGDHGTPPPEATLAVSHMEGEVDLTAWMAGCLACLKPKGRLVLIHRADRLSDILVALRTKDAGDIRILPILPKSGAPARRVIIDAGKGRRSPDTLLAGMALHEDDGRYTPEIEEVLRNAKALLP